MKLILKYFDIAGRGEVLRILLGGCKDVQYVDTRIPFSEWKTVKPTLPLGTLPVLIKDDNIVMTQSTSLYRYVAKLVDLYPENDPFAAFCVDETMDTINELLAKLPSTSGCSDDEAKQKRQEYQTTAIRPALTLIESRIEQFGGSGGTTVCGMPSVADVMLLTFRNSLETGFFTHLDGSVFSDYPLITKVTDAIQQHPIVAAAYKK